MLKKLPSSGLDNNVIYKTLACNLSTAPSPLEEPGEHS